MRVPLELLQRIELWSTAVREQQVPFRADEHRRFTRVDVLDRVQRLHGRGRMEPAVKPLDRQLIAGGPFGTWKHPGDVVGLGPVVAAPIRIRLPRPLHFGLDGLRARQGESFPDGVEEVATHVAGPARAEILPRAPEFRVINTLILTLGVFPRGSRSQPTIPVQTRGHGTAPCRTRALQPVALYGARTVGRQDHALDVSDHALLQDL